MALPPPPAGGQLLTTCLPVKPSAPQDDCSCFNPFKIANESCPVLICLSRSILVDPPHQDFSVSGISYPWSSGTKPGRIRKVHCSLVGSLQIPFLKGREVNAWLLRVVLHCMIGKADRYSCYTVW